MMLNSNPHRDLSEPVGPFDHVLGPEHARVTVVEYSDFQCPNCKHAVPAVKMMLRRFENRVRFAFRHFPLEKFHPHALLAAEVAECAGVQGKFWEMHDLLFDNQSHFELTHLHCYAERLGLDMARYTSEMDEHVHLQRVREQIDSRKRSGVRTTPGFFVDGRIQDVSFGPHLLLDATEAALKNR
jgi:protein-disulfide isomerase